MSVKVESLIKYYGSQAAVNEISFETKSGRILGFLGPNGAGKSTTMKILTGYLKPSAGKVEICGFDIEKQTIEAKKRIGFLPENTPLYYEMYVREFLNFAASSYKIKNANKRVEEVIDMVGLGAEQHKKVGELSKGYKQRVGLAQAIIHKPQVLILDEPTSGLDPNQLAEIRSLIIQIGKDISVIISTHIMQEVEALCDDVIIINKGKIVSNSTLKALKENNNGQDLEEIFRKLTK